MYDVLIRNGVIIDGSGDYKYKGDIAIKEKKIIAIGNLHNETADKIIDASGQYVTPGFIDVNNHSDAYWRIFSNPELESLVYQGITTIIGGNCGSSLAPFLNLETIKSIQKWIDIKKLNFNWLSLEDFLRETGKSRLSINFGTLVGHSTLRRSIAHDELRNLNKKELDFLKKTLRKSLKEGALGLSSGLAYSHAKIAPFEEMKELVRVVAEENKVYATHLREEGAMLLSSLDEALKTSSAVSAKLHISHLKAMGRKNWHLLEKALEKIDAALAEGRDVTFDFYPYTFTSSVLYIFLPDWITRGGKKMMLERIRIPEVRKEALKEMKENNFDYTGLIIANSSLNKHLSRKAIADIAVSQKKTAEEIVLDILIASDGRVTVFSQTLSEENIEKSLVHPASIVASNGSGYRDKHKETKELIHPRSFGTFIKVLSEYVRDKGLLSWEEAIHKMTGKPSQKFGIKKRGIIKEGNFADIAVFAPEELESLADLENPFRYASGINYLLVNGEIVLEKGKYTGKRVGEILKG